MPTLFENNIKMRSCPTCTYELSFSSPSTAYDKEKIDDTKGEF